MTKRNLEASTDISATPEQVWKVVGNLKRMPRWSPQCVRMRLLGGVREGTYSLNWNRQGRKRWPSASKIVRIQPGEAIAFRTLTNNSVWSFEVTPTPTGCRLTERRTVPPAGTARVSATIVKYLLGGEDNFDEEMLDGMKATLANIKAAVEQDNNVLAVEYKQN